MMMSSIKTVRIVIYSTSHAEFYKIGIDLNSVFSLLFYGELDQYENIIEDKKYLCALCRYSLQKQVYP